MADKRIAGVVLAGGLSRRMGQSKALMAYKGVPLVEHMSGLLRDAGVDDVLISGAVEGYDTIADETPAMGPVGGITSVMVKYPDYQRYLFVPVDMPLVAVEALRMLAACQDGGYFTGYPLPACLVPPVSARAGGSVRNLLAGCGVKALDCPSNLSFGMKNINTPQEWAEVVHTS